MSDRVPTIVASKLQPPAEVRDVIRRQRLIDLLASGFDDQASVGLICAPAGSGKTTLLSSYAGTTTGAAWFQVDRRDNDPARFWSHLVAMVDGLREEPTAQLQSHWLRRGDWAAVVETLTADLEQLGAVTLMIDDYHHITTSAIHEHVDQLLHWVPLSTSVLLSTRVDPPLPLVNRLRVRGGLVELRANDLAFDGDDARALLRRAASVEVTAESADGLVARTEGWAAGLYLAGLSIRRHGDPAAVIARFDGDDRLMADYLRSEFLAELDDETRRFMVQTSILSELHGPLCDAVTGMTNSALRLRDLEHSNLLVLPLDSTGDWYRYHHLIEQWLRTELMVNEPDLVAELHGRAAAWFGTADDPEPAYDHAIAAADLAMATDIAEQHWHALLATGRHDTLRTWLDQLVGSVEGSPRLCLARAQLARNTGESAEAARVWLERARELADPTDTEVMVRLHTNMMVHERMVGDLGAAEAHGRQALAAVTDQAVVPEVRSLLGATLGQLGAFGESIDHLTEALATVDPETDMLTEIFARSHLALPLYESGQHRRARDTAQSALDRAAGTNFDGTPILASARVVLGMLCLDDGEREAAKRHLCWAMSAARSVGSDTARLHALLAAARHAVLTKHRLEARRLLGQAQDLIETMPDPGRLASLVDAARQRTFAHPTPSDGSYDPGLIEDLTDREVSVLRLLGSELSLRDVGNELSMSYNTAKGHAKVIYRKLGVHSRADAVAAATRLGLL